MPLWNEFKDNDATPKDRRLLLITQPSGTPDGQEIDIHDVVVGHWNSHLAGFVQAIAPPDQSAGSILCWCGKLGIVFEKSSCPAIGNIRASSAHFESCHAPKDSIRSLRMKILAPITRLTQHLMISSEVTRPFRQMA
jgi:hypothetical protein